LYYVFAKKSRSVLSFGTSKVIVFFCRDIANLDTTTTKHISSSFDGWMDVNRWLKKLDVNRFARIQPRIPQALYPRSWVHMSV